MSWRWGLILIVGLNWSVQAQVLDSLSCWQGEPFLRLDSTYGETYPLVSFPENQFTFYSKESPTWAKFYDKLERMIVTGEGKLNMYHIGGSHLQADIYTHDFRTMLQQEWSNLPGERGWVFPFDLARTNNPWNYDFKSSATWTGYRAVVSRHRKTEEFGLLGAKIVSYDSIADLRFKYDNTVVKPGMTNIKVFHNKGFFPYQFNWGGAEVLRTKTYMDTILGYTEFQFSEPLDSFNLVLTRTISNNYPLEIYGFLLGNDSPGISYTSIGINGAGLYTYLDCERYEEQLKVHPPDFFAFSVGTNDGNVPYSEFKPEVYKANLDSMMQLIYRTNPDCAILLTVPNDSYYRRRYLNRNIARERDMIIELAAEYEIPVWDLYGIMGELGSSKKWYYAKLMKSDLIHFTRKGYHLKGEIYADAFWKYVELFGERKALRQQIEGHEQF